MLLLMVLDQPVTNDHLFSSGIQKDYSKMLAHRIYTKASADTYIKVLWLLLYIYKQYIFTIHTTLQ